MGENKISFNNLETELKKVEESVASLWVFNFFEVWKSGQWIKSCEFSKRAKILDQNPNLFFNGSTDF